LRSVDRLLVDRLRDYTHKKRNRLRRISSEPFHASQASADSCLIPGALTARSHQVRV
jgi:hypothetical protein